MKKLIGLLSLVFVGFAAQAAIVTVGSWTPIFKGVELASGSQQAQTAGERNHQVLCFRVDLTDPDIELLTTPKCTNCGTFDTLAENTSHFVEQYGVEAAVNGGFYSSSSGPNDVPVGTTENVFGLAISRGTIVSPANDPTRSAALLFTTNNQFFFVPTNNPGTNTAGIYTAVSGDRPLLINGVNVGVLNANDLDPRTAVGVSQDGRYLFLMTLDGRQPGWSDGADFFNTGEWLKRFGAYNGVNVDGGGSTTMVMADCQGKPVRLNRSSFVAAYGRERNIGHNFGVHAKPLPTELKDLAIAPGTTTATLTWRTDADATTQVEYGLTANYGNATPLDSRLVKNHVATISGLAQGSNYFFRAISTTGSQQFTQACGFVTGSSLVTTQVFGLNQTWSFTTNNLDGVNWKARAYTEPGWLGSGPGLLYVEDNVNVAPKGTVLPPPFVLGQTIPRTYYFRTHFTFAGSVAGVSLTFSNYLDDGAVYYLNGAEIFRLRMPTMPITYATGASGTPCAGQPQSGDALPTCPDVFTVGGGLVSSNLLQGDNVIAVEVHNSGTGPDIVFGCTLLASRPGIISPRLNLLTEAGAATLFWNGEGFTLQQSSDLSSSNNWSDVPGSVMRSPVTVSNAATKFYRLRN